MDDTEKPKPRFDPDSSPQSEHNRLAATARGLRFDQRKGSYVDAEGSLIADEFGQRY